MKKNNREIKNKITELSLFNSKEKTYYPNKIINAKQEYSVLEKRIFYCIINQLSNINVDDKDNNDLIFTIALKTFGDTCYDHIIEAAKKLMERKLEWWEYDRKVVLIPFYELNIINFEIKITMAAKSIKYFKTLSQGYTTLDYEICMGLTKVGSQRLYEILNGYLKQGKTNISINIDFLKYQLGIEKDKSYNGITGNANFKNRFIVPAQKELLEKSNLEFIYNFKKNGRKIESIIFTITDKINYVKKVINNKINLYHLENEIILITRYNNVIKEYPNLKLKIVENIKKNKHLLIKFLELHAKFNLDKKVENKEAYICAILRKFPNWQE